MNVQDLLDRLNVKVQNEEINSTDEIYINELYNVLEVMPSGTIIDVNAEELPNG